jgi:hypothetical protein
MIYDGFVTHNIIRNTINVIAIPKREETMGFLRLIFIFIMD